MVVQVLIPGSLPVHSRRDVFDLLFSELGDKMIAVPTGEVGRSNWILDIVKDLATQYPFYVKKEGGLTNYNDLTRLGVSRRDLNLSHFNLGYLDLFLDDFNDYVAAKTSFNISTPYLVTIPSPFDLAVAGLGPVNGMRYLKSFYEATVLEMSNISAQASLPIKFQIECPFETIAGTLTPSLFTSMTSSLMSRLVLGYGSSRLALIGAEDGVGIHCCLGDMNHTAKGRLKSLRPIVSIANSIDKRCAQEGIVLDYIHLPLAAGYFPPCEDPYFYFDLKYLNINPKTKFVAGFLHEGISISQAHRLHEILSFLMGREVHVAPSCGLGRRSLSDARLVISQAASLTRDC